MTIDEWVRRILRERRRERRAAILNDVPYHMRERVQREVEHRWKQHKRKTETRSGFTP